MAAAGAAARARYIGHLDGLAQRSVNGWIANAENFNERLGIEILIDGAVVVASTADNYRPDLMKAGIGKGHHGFSVELPRALFDGQRHDLLVRETSSGWALPLLAQVHFDAAHRVDLASHVAAKLEGSRLVGFVYDTAEPSRPLKVALRVEGRVLAQTVADQPALLFPSDRLPPSSCAFAIDLADLDINALMAGEAELVILPDQIVFGRPANLGRQVATAAIMPAEDMLYVTVELALALRRNVHFDIDLDGSPRGHVILGRLAELNAALIRIPLQEVAAGEHEVSVRYAGTPAQVGNSPQRFQHRPRRNLIANPRFQAWSGSRPEAWRLAVPDGVSIAPAYLAAGAAPGRPTGGYALALTRDDPAATLSGASLSQAFDIPGQRLDSVEVILAGRASSPTEVAVAVSFEPDGRPGAELRQTLALRPNWSAATLRFDLAAVKHGGTAGLTASLGEGAASRVEIGLLAAGPRGFEPEGGLQLLESLVDQGTDAVLNGGFASWSGPLRRSLEGERIAIADGWELATKQANAGLEARLTEILTRDPKSGRSGTTSYGVALHGPIAGPYLRLETELDKLQLAAREPTELSFYARPAQADLEPGDGMRPAIHAIFILDRRTPADGAASRQGEEQKLVALRYRLDVRGTGEAHVVPLKHADARLLRAEALKDLYDAGRRFVLVFEFHRHVNCALTDVHFGASAGSGRRGAAVSGFIALEDANIAAQLPLLKGLAHWAEPRRFEPAAGVPRGSAELRPAAWRWPAAAARSVEIVICVHDAIDETLDCLRSIGAATAIPHTITLVDDGSLALHRERLRQAVKDRPWIGLVELDGNLGYTRAANVGLSRSTAEWVVLLNSDTIVTPGWLEGMFDVVDAKPHVAMVGPLSNAASWQSVPELHDANGQWKINAIPEGCSIDDIAALVAEHSRRGFPEVTLLNGFCTLMRRSVIAAVGYLDEAAFPVGYGEENDLCIRVRKAGHALAIADHVYVYHVKSASFGSRQRRELSKRGTASFMAKHPDVDLREEQRVLAESVPLIELRTALKARLQDAPRRARKASA